MTLSADALEEVARAIHENYRSDQAERKPSDDPALALWDDLPAHLKQSNRHQAGRIFEQLRAIGCSVHEAHSAKAEVISLSAEDVERMAEMEHDRWTAERIADGWTPGERDVVAKKSPYLVSWEELSEDVREWDREAVRRIPELLAGVNLEVRRER